MKGVIQVIAILLVMLHLNETFKLKISKFSITYFILLCLVSITTISSSHYWHNLFLLMMVIITFEDLMFMEVDIRSLLLLLIFYLSSQIHQLFDIFPNLLGLLFIWLVYQKLVATNNPFVGHGDIDLLFILIFILGSANFLQFIYILSVMTLIILIPLLLLKIVQLKQTIPYIPIMTVSYLIYLLW